MSDEGFYAIEFDGRPGVAYCNHEPASEDRGAWEKWSILFLRDHGYSAYTFLGSEDKAFARLKIVALVNERDIGRQPTAALAIARHALHTVTVERDAPRQQFDGNKELCVICGELCSSYAGNPNRWPVRLGNDGWRHIGCVNKQLAERDALRWTCFHCGETFTIPGLAAEHFGYADGDTPACKIKAGHERNLVAALRDAQCELDRYRAEDSDKDREFHAMRADHATALRRKEEAGYNKGVRDMTVERDALRQALGDIIKLCPKVLHGERDVVDIAEIAHAILKGDQGAEVAAAMQEVAKRGIIKEDDNA